MSVGQPSKGGLGILRDRQARLPAALHEALTVPLGLEAAARAIRSARWVVTTGVGSSLAHARYLSWLLRTHAGIASWDVPTGSFLVPPPRSGLAPVEDVLVVFSQGLSPNARFPLAHAGQYRALVLVTAAEGDSASRAAVAREAAAAGAIIVSVPCAPEYEVLMRIVGPMVGFAVALRIAHAAGAAVDVAPEPIVRAVGDGASRAIASLARVDARVFADPITFVGTSGYAQHALSACAKVQEGMYLPWPQALDVLELAHGAIQEASGKPHTFIALGRLGAPHEDALFARARQVSESQHRWLRFDARLAEPLAVLEHEAMINELVLASIASRSLDPQQWPGKGRDGPLYSLASAKDLASDVSAPEPPDRPAPRSVLSRRLEELTWPEIEAQIGAGQRTAVVPLGATEQHGPHMPLAVDSWIAEALASRFCAQVPEALQAPTLSIGCSTEHLAFAGTLSISSATLTELLRGVIASLVAHGFSHVVVFSAHGGNDAALASAEASLREGALPARLTVVHGIDAIACMWQQESARAGAPPGAAGHHAGEFETSIIAALRPEALRWSELRGGVSGDVPDPQRLFYPSLRDHAPEGVVGDPSQARPERGERYLQAWTSLIVDAYRSAPQVRCARRDNGPSR